MATPCNNGKGLTKVQGHVLYELLLVSMILHAAIPPLSSGAERLFPQMLPPAEYTLSEPFQKAPLSEGGITPQEVEPQQHRSEALKDELVLPQKLHKGTSLSVSEEESTEDNVKTGTQESGEESPEDNVKTGTQESGEESTEDNVKTGTQESGEESTEDNVKTGTQESGEESTEDVGTGTQESGEVSLISEFLRLQIEVKGLNKDKKALKEKNEELDKENNQLRRENKECNEKIEDLTREKEQLTRDKDQLTKDKEEVEKQLQSRDENVDELTKDKEELEKQLQFYKTRIAELEKKIEEVSKEKDKLIKENEQRLKVLEDKVSNLQITNKESTDGPSEIKIKDSDGVERKLVLGEQINPGSSTAAVSVFKGRYECDVAIKKKRELAVKAIMGEAIHYEETESSILRTLHHKNVIKYVHMHKDPHKNLCYIIMELCPLNLEQYYSSEGATADTLGNDPDKERHFLPQLADGLEYIHSENIVHGDIKPSNVLLTSDYQVKISDFGISKRVDTSKNSQYAERKGTVGWTAPEVKLKRGKLSKAGDIFSMGCVMYFVLTRGCHPFDPLKCELEELMDPDEPLEEDELEQLIFHEREGNILKKSYKCKFRDLQGTDMHVAKDLIQSMIEYNRKNRPCSKGVKDHCFFWSLSKQKRFFHDVRERILHSRVSRGIADVIKIWSDYNWIEYIDKDLAKGLRKYAEEKGYSRIDGRGIKELISTIRNMCAHPQPYDKYMPVFESVVERGFKEKIETPEKIVKYFTAIFPKLLIEMWKACQKEKGLKEENMTYYHTECPVKPHCILFSYTHHS